MILPHKSLPLLGSSPMLRLDSLHKFLGYACPPSHSDPGNAILSADLDMVFPPAKSIEREIEALGIDPITASTFSDAYLSAASSLRERCKHFVRRSITSLQSSTPDITMKYMLSLRKRYHTIYHHLLNTWKASTIRQSCPNSKARHTFKRDGLPLLLRYFDYNMYPSPADKAVLAKKTGLTSRQIETWFQNHRNRAPKPLKRLDSRETPFNFDLSEETPCDNQGSSKLKIPVDAEVFQPSTQKISRVIKRPSVLDKSVSASAINNPTFNPLEPFSFEESDWPHPPRPSPRPRKKVVFDVEDFCQSFQNSLNLRRNYKRSHSDSLSEESDSRSWTYLHHIVLFPKRHPALVRTIPPATPPRRQQSMSSDNSTIVSPPRMYKPLPRHSLHTAFLKYQKEEGRMDVLTTHHCSQNKSSPAANSSPLTPTSHRRSSSASSLDTSVACVTPISFSNSVSIVLQQPDNTYVSCATKDDDPLASITLQNAKRPRLQNHFDLSSLLNH